MSAPTLGPTQKDQYGSPGRAYFRGRSRRIGSVWLDGACWRRVWLWAVPGCPKPYRSAPKAATRIAKSSSPSASTVAMIWSRVCAAAKASSTRVSRAAKRRKPRPHQAVAPPRHPAAPKRRQRRVVRTKSRLRRAPNLQRPGPNLHRLRLLRPSRDLRQPGKPGAIWPAVGRAIFRQVHKLGRSPHSLLKRPR